MHADLSGGWKYPKDILAWRAESAVAIPGLSEEGREKLRKRLVQGETWFVDPDKFEEAIEVRDREYARRLKDLYRGKAD